MPVAKLSVAVAAAVLALGVRMGAVSGALLLGSADAEGTLRVAKVSGAVIAAAPAAGAIPSVGFNSHSASPLHTPSDFSSDDSSPCRISCDAPLSSLRRML